ncbi:hypothetical protein NKG94_04180 [Micromonospora sp. M12]
MAIPIYNPTYLMATGKRVRAAAFDAQGLPSSTTPGWTADMSWARRGDRYGVRSTMVRRRLFSAVTVLIGVVTVAFAVVHLIPGDPVQTMLGTGVPSSTRPRRLPCATSSVWTARWPSSTSRSSRRRHRGLR